VWRSRGSRARPDRGRSSAAALRCRGRCRLAGATRRQPSARLPRIRSPLGLTAAGRLRTDLGCRPHLDGARKFALGHAKLLSRASAQQRAGGLAQQRAATQTPRRPIGAGGVRGASRSGSASVITTHALFALKVQRKVSNGIAGLAADEHRWIRRNRGPIRALLRCHAFEKRWIEALKTIAKNSKRKEDLNW
jgi:NADH:ubiquinone oxidoreductase, NDUFS5-15kDa